MARDDGDDIRIRPGRSRRAGRRANPRELPFTRQVELAVRRAGGNPSRIGRGGAGRKGGSGRFNAHGRGAKAVASFPRDGGNWQRDSIGRFRSRRVVVKARVVKLASQRGSRGPRARGVSRAADAHLRYLERDGVTRDGEQGRAYSAFENEADGRAFIERGRDDRHQFRLIVAPEDSVEMDDLRGFTRDLMRRTEQGPRLRAAACLALTGAEKRRLTEQKNWVRVVAAATAERELERRGGRDCVTRLGGARFRTRRVAEWNGLTTWVRVLPGLHPGLYVSASFGVRSPLGSEGGGEPEPGLTGATMDRRFGPASLRAAARLNGIMGRT